MSGKLALAAALIAAPITGLAAEPIADTLAVTAQVAQAQKLAGRDLTQPLFLCHADQWETVRAAMAKSDQWLKPVKVFDNFYFIGNEFVGVWVLRTNAGLILFDATEGEAQARDHLIPALRELDLDPATIRYVIVSHGHYDHFGGAAWLQRTYGAHIALSAADWAMIEALPNTAAERHNTELPRRDITVTDGQVLKLGDASVRLYVTPGHTPGAVSAIVPARDGARSVPISLLGSTAFPATLDPTPRTGGLLAYDRSVLRFARISRAAGAQGIVNNHIFADGTRQRLEAIITGKTGAHNPFEIGTPATARYYGILHRCLRAAILRGTGPTPPNFNH